MPQKRLHLQRVLTSAGFTQEELAHRLGVDVSTVRRWEAGHTTPSAWLWPKLGKLLGMSRAELIAQFETDTEAGQDDTPNDDQGCIEENDMNRRNLLKTLGLGAASVGGLSGARDIVLDAAHSSALLGASIESHGISHRALAHARDQLAQLATDYALTSDLEPILRDLVVLRNHLAAIVTSSHRPAEVRDLYQLLGATCALLASVSHDLSEPRAGMVQADTAETFAELSGDRALLASVLCTKEMIASWWGTPTEVLEHTAKAHAAGPVGISAIRLAGLEARALAELGRRTDALAVVHRAEDHRARVGEHDELRELGEVFTFSSARQHYYNATTYRHLGSWREVEYETSKVIDLYSGSSSENIWPVTLTLSRIYQAQARLHVDGPDGAHEALCPVLSIPAPQWLPQTAQALAGLGSELRSTTFAALPVARDMNEAIMTFRSPVVR